MLKMTLQFSWKTPHEIFEQYANAELKLKILEKKQIFVQKNTTNLFNVEVFETFCLLLVIILSHEQECFTKMI